MGQLNYPISTTALSLTASGTTIGSGNTQSATFVVARTMVRTGIGAGELLSGSRTWSIHYVISAMATPYEMRLKLQRRNSSQVVQSESSYGTTRSSTGTYDDNITWDSGTWNANDELALVWEHRRPSGTGNKNGTMDANGSSYVNAPNEITGSVTESASATDAPVSSVNTNSSITESGTATESQSPNKVTLSDIAETTSASDSQAASFLFTASVTESGTATETESVLLTTVGTITESGSATESVSVLLISTPAISEAATADESESALLITSSDITESVSSDTTQSVLLITGESITESGNALDVSDGSVSGGGGTTYNVSISESGSAGDTSDAVVATGIQLFRSSGPGLHALIESKRKKIRKQDDELMLQIMNLFLEHETV